MLARSLFVLILISLLFTLLEPDFLSTLTWASILTSSADIGIIVLGVTLLMIVGEFDLSVGANLALSGFLFASLITHQSGWAALCLALIAGGCIGLLNGVITLFFRIPSFIVTLSTMLACRGLVLLLTNGFPLSIDQPDPVMNLFSANLGQGILASSLWFVIIGFYLTYLLRMTKWGNHIYATGSHAKVAYTMGVDTTKIKLLVFVVCGILAALAGVVQFSHLNSLSPTAGEQYELYAIAAAVIGGNSLKGGTGSLCSAMVGIILINVIDTGLIQAGVSIYWHRVFLALILITTAIINLNAYGLMDNFKKSYSQ